jgi:hypothetical protein
MCINYLHQSGRTGKTQSQWLGWKLDERVRFTALATFFPLHNCVKTGSEVYAKTTEPFLSASKCTKLYLSSAIRVHGAFSPAPWAGIRCPLRVWMNQRPCRLHLCSAIMAVALCFLCVIAATSKQTRHVYWRNWLLFCLSRVYVVSKWTHNGEILSACPYMKACKGRPAQAPLTKDVWIIEWMNECMRGGP